MTKRKTAQNRDDFQLTKYAQAVIAILKKLGILTLALTIPTAAFIITDEDVQQAQIYVAQEERTAILTVDPTRSTVINGELFRVKVNLDTGGSQITEARAVLRYDQDLIQIDQVNFVNLAKNNYVDINNAIGKATVQSFFNADAPGYFSGKTQWLELVVSSHNVGTADFWFDCRKDAVDETNILRFGGDDIVDCNRLGQGWFSVELVDKSVVENQDNLTCSQSAPIAPQNLQAYSGPGRGEVTLKWPLVAKATHYTVTYGLASNSYQYGSPNIGKTDQFLVKGLMPGKRYWFVVTAVDQCASSGYSNEVNTTAGYGAFTVNDNLSIGEKGFQPPIPPEFLPDEEASDAADEIIDLDDEDITDDSLSLQDDDSLALKQDLPFFKRLDFWLLAGGIALGGLLLILIGSLIGSKAKEKSQDKVEKKPDDGKSDLPPSPWETPQQGG